MKKRWSGGGFEVTVVVRVAVHGVGSDGMILVRDGGGACGDEMVVGWLWSVIGGGVVSVEVVMVATVRRVMVAEMVVPAVDRDEGGCGAWGRVVW
nr:hypothetical protein [Tanacetum cinerariifolium]